MLVFLSDKRKNNEAYHTKTIITNVCITAALHKKYPKYHQTPTGLWGSLSIILHTQSMLRPPASCDLGYQHQVGTKNKTMNNKVDALTKHKAANANIT